MISGCFNGSRVSNFSDPGSCFGFRTSSFSFGTKSLRGFGLEA